MKTIAIILIGITLITFPFSRVENGTYYSTNPNSQTGVAKAIIATKGNSQTQYLTLWFKCYPQDCNMGQHKLEEYSAHHNFERKRARQGQKWFDYNKPINIKRGDLTYKIYLYKHSNLNDHIRLKITTIYNDPNKEDKTASYILKSR